MLARVEFGIVGRTRGAGRAGSAVAAAAYNLAARLMDEAERTYDYSRKSGEHAGGCVLLPPGAPPGLGTPDALWRAAEACERRSDAQLARQLLVSVPREVLPEDRIAFLHHLVAPYVTDGMACQVDIHCPRAADGGEQPHAHVLLSLRRVSDAGFGKAKVREWNQQFRKDGGRAERARLSERATAWLSTHGVAGTYDLRSLAERGDDRPPEPSVPIADWKRWQREGADPAAPPPTVAAVLVHRNRRAALARAQAEQAQAAEEVAALTREAAEGPAAPAIPQETPVPAAPAPPAPPTTPMQEDTMPKPSTPTTSRRRPSWTTRQGGLEALPDALRVSAQASYARWTASRPDLAARHGLADYVSYVQGQRDETPAAPAGDDEDDEAREGQVPAPVPAGGRAFPSDDQAGQVRRAQHLAALLAGRYPAASPDLARHLWRMDTDESAGVTRLHLRGGGTVIDHGDRLTHDGDTTPAIANAVAAAAAAHGWTSVRLSGSEDYRDAVGVACALRVPPIATDHALSPAARERLAAAQVQRASDAVPRLDMAAVARTAARDPRAAAEAHLDHADAMTRATLAGRPTGPTLPHELSGPRVSVLEARRDASREDATEAAEAAAGHRAAHAWTSRVLPGAARRRQAALDGEATRLGKEARALEAGHGKAVRAIERSARREAAATADALESWRWSPAVRRAERDLAATQAVRAALAGQDPTTIAAAATGDLRAAGRAAGVYAEQVATPGEGPLRVARDDAESARWTRQEALARCQRWEAGAEGAEELEGARRITAAVVAGDRAATASVAAGDSDGAGEAATAWRRRVEGAAAAAMVPATVPAVAPAYTG